MRVSGAHGSRAAVVAGLASGEGDHLLAVWDCGRRRLALELRHGGRTRRLRSRRVDLPDAFGLAFVLCENQATALVETGEGWRPLLTERERVRRQLDLRVPATLARFRYTWGAPGSGPAGSLGSVDSARAGLFGMTGLRDLHLVQHADGTPYLRDGRAYLTATCAGMGFFPQAHWGVFAFDPERPLPLEHVGQLFFRRDGLLLGDHAGQVVRDGDRWIVATSTWGDFAHDGVHVRHTTTGDDVLHGVHVLATDRTPLPTGLSSWDPSLTRIGGAWHVAFVESGSQRPFDFHPALAVADPWAEWPGGLRLVAAATHLRHCEGPVLSEVEGRWWVLASDGDARRYPVFTTALERVGHLDAPYGTNIPHPQLVRLSGSRYLLLTFDGTPYGGRLLGYGGHGDVLAMHSGP